MVHHDVCTIIRRTNADLDASFSHLNEPTVPLLPIDDEENPDIVVMDTKISIRVSRKMQSFKHVVCKPGVCPINPQFGTFYEMTKQLPHWFRDNVNFATGHKNKNTPTVQKISAWDEASVKYTRRWRALVFHLRMICVS